MEVAYTILAAQGLLGAWDNLWNHEYKVGLAHRAGARRELVLHALRAALYVPMFLVFAWLDLTGWFAVAFVGLLVSEIAITLSISSRRIVPVRCLRTNEYCIPFWQSTSAPFYPCSVPSFG